jgi:hypothetical protein
MERWRSRGGNNMSAKLVIVIATALVSWISAGCTVHCFWHFFRHPASFNSGRSGKLANAYIVFVLLGLGYCIFSGVEAMVGWIPRNWVSYSDDGEDPIWVGYVFASIVAFFGSQVFLYEMAKLAHRVEDCERSALGR